jgi:hypothetical protein
MSTFAMWLSGIGLALNVGGVAASLGAIVYD